VKIISSPCYASNPILRKLMTIVLISSGAIILQSCLPVMIGGTVAGAMAATDRRTIGVQADDASIELRVMGRANKIIGEQGRIAVASFNHRVLITGEVPDEKIKIEVERQILTVTGVASVENDLIVAPKSSVGIRANDVVITSKVKAAIIDTKDLYLTAFKIHTDRGVVYLMGRVTQREGKLAAEVARNAASKIVRVVKLFEYISEDDLKELNIQQSTGQQKNNTQ
jgi:osmotically-inducible protein OsmY